MCQTMDILVAVNKQISQVILMPGNNAILLIYQINTHYNTHATLSITACAL